MYREMGLQLRNKAPKRRIKAKLREDRKEATRPNETWAMDFVHDQLATGRKIRVLTVVDTFSRYAPALARASAIGPRMSFKRWSRSAARLAIQPATVTKRRKLQPPAIQNPGAHQ